MSAFSFGRDILVLGPLPMTDVPSDTSTTATPTFISGGLSFSYVGSFETAADTDLIKVVQADRIDYGLLLPDGGNPTQMVAYDDQLNVVSSGVTFTISTPGTYFISVFGTAPATYIMYGSATGLMSEGLFSTFYNTRPSSPTSYATTFAQSFGLGGGHHWITDVSVPVTIYGLGSDVYGTDADNFMRGGAYGDWLDAKNGDNLVFGGGGADVIFSGDGTDVLAGEGGDDVIYSGNGRDTLWGGPGNDFLSGGNGADKLFGGVGNDTYWLISEASGIDSLVDLGGVDTILSAISRSLAHQEFAEIENLTLKSGTTGYGNNLANIITGNVSNNILFGAGGNDTLLGLAGNDRLSGEAGLDKLDGGSGVDTLIGGTDADTLSGGIGIDYLTGGLGNDFFVFSAPVIATNRDIITDFGNVSGNNDTIRLENAYFTKIGAPGVLKYTAFKLSTQVKDADDRIIYNKTAGHLYYDADGSGAVAPVLIAQFTTVKPTLSHTDFVVI